jgi:hypothetical protein
MLTMMATTMRARKRARRRASWAMRARSRGATTRGTARKILLLINLCAQ